MRGRTGASGHYNAVTLADRRRHNLRELLLDLSRPGLCIVLGAGASRGVIPMSRNHIAQLAHDLLEAHGNKYVLPSRSLEELTHPAVVFMTDILQRSNPGSWDRIISELTPGSATFLLHEVFTPHGEVPAALVEIYDILENERGVIVSYNYDRITDRQSRFRVIAPHGQRSHVLQDARTRQKAIDMAWELHIALPTDLWLPVPETEAVRHRNAYREAINAWRVASAVVFVGYGFGAGNDLFSFGDFGENLSRTARVHVLNPQGENADLTKQVASTVRDRNRGACVWGQPFRWQSFAEAVLQVVRAECASHIRSAIGREVEIAFLHDRR